MGLPFQPGAGDAPLALELRVKMALDYIDKEMTAMAWLASIGAAIALAAVSQPLFLRKEKEFRLGSLLNDVPDSALLALGCVILLSSSACFLAQRIKLTSSYGQTCGLLLAESDPSAQLASVIEWKSWRPYKWGMRLLVIGAAQTVVGLVLLNWSLTRPSGLFTHASAWVFAVAAPLASYGLFKLAKKVRRRMHS